MRNDSHSGGHNGSCESTGLDELADIIGGGDVWLRTLCDEIKNKFKFDYTSIQVIRRKEEIIETVTGNGIAVGVEGGIKHHFSEREVFPDIQADIGMAMPPKAEAIHGWDDRFDEYIYETHHHGDLSRIWVPILIARDAKTNAIVPHKEWKSYYEWKGKNLRGSKKHWRAVVRLRRVENQKPVRSFKLDVLGTVEAGYGKERTKRISPEEIIELADDVAKHGPELFMRKISSLFECILQEAIREAQADSGTFHYLYDQERAAYLYEFASGVRKSFLREHPPRDNGIGRQAVRMKRPLVMDESRLRDELPGLYGLKRGQFIRTLVALPILVGPPPGPRDMLDVGRKNASDDSLSETGVLYLHFESATRPSRRVLANWMTLINRVQPIIWLAMSRRHIRERIREYRSLGGIMNTLFSQDHRRNVLDDLAGEIRVHLGADVVSIYKKGRDGMALPDSLCGKSGRLLDDTRSAHPPTLEGAKYEGPTLIESRKSGKGRGGSPYERWLRGFMRREHILCAVNIPIQHALGSRGGMRGLMMVGYRYRHRFGEIEKAKCEVLAGGVDGIFQMDASRRLARKNGFRPKAKSEHVFLGYAFGKMSRRKRDKLRLAVEAGVKKSEGYEHCHCRTVESESGSPLIFDRIKKYIKNAKLCVFALPKKVNSNVYLEIGLAIGYNKPIELLRLPGVPHRAVPSPISASLTHPVGRIQDLKRGFLGMEPSLSPMISREAYSIPGPRKLLIANGGIRRQMQDFDNAVVGALGRPALPVVGIAGTDALGDIRAHALAPGRKVFRVDDRNGKNAPLIPAVRASAATFVALGICLAGMRKADPAPILVTRYNAHPPSDLVGQDIVRFTEYTDLTGSLQTRLGRTSARGR